MKARWKILRPGVVMLGLWAFTHGGTPAHATPGYRAAESAGSAPELRAEMSDYDPAMLSIHFSRNPELPATPPDEPPESGSVFAELLQPIPEASPAEDGPRDTIPAAAFAPPASISTPEPGTFALLGLGLSLAALLMRRRKTR